MINQNMKPVTTNAGLIEGRDAIYLDRINFVNKDTLIIEGDLNRNLCSEYKDIPNLIRFIPYRITFNNVVYYDYILQDKYTGVIESNFDVVEKENIFIELPELNKAVYSPKISDNHKLYFFRTYDEIYRVIATDFNFKISKRIIKPVITEIGLLRYGSVINLEIKTFLNYSELLIEGTLSGNLEHEHDSIPFSVSFNNVIYLNEVLETAYHPLIVSCFDMIGNEKIIEELPELDKNILSKITPEHQLYIFSTYEKVIKIISTDFVFKLKK